MGTKTVYTPELLKKIEELATRGYPKVMIEKALGLPKDSISKQEYNYRGEDKRYCKFKELKECLTRAREKYIQFHLQRGQEVGDKDWRFHEHRLAIIEPQHFSEKKRLEHSGEGGKPLEIQIVKHYATGKKIVNPVAKSGKKDNK